LTRIEPAPDSRCKRNVGGRYWGVVVPTTAKQKPLIKSAPSTGSGQGAKYKTGLTVHAPEPMIVTPFYAVVSIGMIWVSRPNGQMSRVGNNYCAACVPVVAPDFDTAGKGDC